MKPLLVGFGEDGRPILLTREDLRTHVHGIGASRSGKSKFAEGIARQLTLNREGFCLIDPHGFLIADLLRSLAYLNPPREIIVLDPSSAARVVGFNPFRALGTTDIGARVDRLVQVILKAWGQTSGDETPRLERWLRCLGHVLVEGGYTINLAPQLVSWQGRELRQDVIGRVKDRLTIHIRQEWEELDTYRRLPDFNAQIESTKNRLLRFVDSLPIRRMMGVPSNSLNVEDVIEGGKILLVNLQPSAELTKDHARVVGALLVSDLWEVARRRRQGAGGRAPRRFHLLIDEFHEYLIPDVPEMLTGGAKYGLHLWLFHQNLDQLRAREPAVFGALDSARIKLVFGGLGRVDARLMAENIYPGQIDLKRVKFLIEQTKFRPVYCREKVYSSGRGGGEGTFYGHSETSGFNESSHPSWDPSFESWVETRGSGATFGSTSSFGSSELRTWSEGTADVPFLMPKPFKETSSIEYSLEEQLWQLTDQLMEQATRHFFLRRPGQQTVAVLTPRITPRYVTPDRVARYIEFQLSQFLTPDEVDRAIENIHRRLALAAGVVPPALTEGDYVR